MKTIIIAGAAIAATATLVGAQACDPGTAQEIMGNWYCKPVKAITYSEFGSTGSYNRVTSMDGGTCKSEPFEYSGALAPLDGEVSWNFRGPLNLKQFAFYAPAASPEKRSARPGLHERRGYGHAPFHKRERERRAVADVITATIDGEVVSWADDPGQDIATPRTADAAERVTNTVVVEAIPSKESVAPEEPEDGETKEGVLQGAAPGMNAGSGEWGRKAYYNAEEQLAEGLVFLNNMGGQGSGVFDEELGMSLSYAASDATTGSSSPQILHNDMLGDGDEVVIMSDEPCTEGGECGTTRPGGVAHHGFSSGSASKLFLLEFDMPLTGARGWNMDMPAAWILNAEITNTLQYGRPECSCWESGCGEWDIFEVLDSGNTRCKSTIHGNIAGGDSNYFARPVDQTVKVAVIFDGENSAGHIVVLPDDTAFDPSLSDAQMAGLLDNLEGLGSEKSLFRLGSYQQW